MKKVPSSPGTIPKHPKSAVVSSKKTDASESETKAAKGEKEKVPVIFKSPVCFYSENVVLEFAHIFTQLAVCIMQYLRSCAQVVHDLAFQLSLM